MDNDQANRMRWDRRAAEHCEQWSVSFNHRASNVGFWIRFGLVVPRGGQGAPVARVWFGLFDGARPAASFGINRGLPPEQIVASEHPFALVFGDAELTCGSTTGRLAGEGHDVYWELSFEPAPFVHCYQPEAAYRQAASGTKVISANPAIYLGGKVLVDGKLYEFSGEPGTQTHRWARRPARGLAWCHCSAFREDQTAVLEVLSLRTGAWPLPRRLAQATTMSLYLGAEVFAFREPWTRPLTHGRWETGAFRFGATGPHVKLEGRVGARPEDLVRAGWNRPDGLGVFAHHTAIADARVTVWNRRSPAERWRQLCRLTSRGTTHFEYVDREPDGRVTREHQAVEPPPPPPPWRGPT